MLHSRLSWKGVHSPREGRIIYNDEVKKLIECNGWFNSQLGLTAQTVPLKLDRGCSASVLSLQNTCDHYIVKIEIQRRKAKLLKVKINEGVHKLESKVCLDDNSVILPPF
jgi:hypothetical protein